MEKTTVKAFLFVNYRYSSIRAPVQATVGFYCVPKLQLQTLQQITCCGKGKSPTLSRSILCENGQDPSKFLQRPRRNLQMIKKCEEIKSSQFTQKWYRH